MLSYEYYGNWKERNMRGFEGPGSSVDVLVKQRKVVSDFLGFLSSISRHSTALILISCKEVVFSYFALIQNRPVWSPLATGAFMLNFDGSVSGNVGPAGI